jgi:hypothetical protein
MARAKASSIASSATARTVPATSEIDGGRIPRVGEASPLVPRRSRRWRGGPPRTRVADRRLNSGANAITIRKSKSGKLRLVTLTPEGLISFASTAP